MVYKNSQAFIEEELITFVIGDLDRKFGRSNQGSEVRAIRPGSVFRSDDSNRLSLLNLPGLTFGATTEARRLSLAKILIKMVRPDT